MKKISLNLSTLSHTVLWTILASLEFRNRSCSAKIKICEVFSKFVQSSSNNSQVSNNTVAVVTSLTKRT